jgi:hypothetical protein
LLSHLSDLLLLRIFENFSFWNSIIFL